MPHDESPPVLHADGLTKRYGRRHALSGVTLTVPHGRIVGLVGPNGAGKSTLLQLACGLIEPTSGTLRVLGSRPTAKLARVGFVAQDTPVYAGLSVAELGASAVLSSHLLGDIEQVCDHIIVLSGGRVQVAGDIGPLRAAHGKTLEDLVLAYLGRAQR